jgi:hypothetical protein
MTVRYYSRQMDLSAKALKQEFDSCMKKSSVDRKNGLEGMWEKIQIVGGARSIRAL